MPDGTSDGARAASPPTAWLVPAALLSVAAASSWLYDVGSRAVAEVVILAFFLCLVLGPSLVYPCLRRSGVATGRAVAAALLLPALWLLKECWATGRIHGMGPGLYYALNPIALGLLTGAAVQMAVAELWLRRARSGRLELASGPGLVLGVVFLLALVIAWVAQGNGGRVLFYGYVAVYRQLFGG